jgi:DNA-binding transcriptional LysR family regulator
MDRLAAMAVLARVAACGSLSAAARELGLSRSAVSKQVRALDDRLGARLIDRTTRHLSPTEVGRAYQDWCLRLLGQIEEAEQVASAPSHPGRPLVRPGRPGYEGGGTRGGERAWPAPAGTWW